MKRVVITGFGVTCANTVGKEALYALCKSGRNDFSKVTVFDGSALKTEYFGENKQILGKNRVQELSQLAIKEMLEDARQTKETLTAMGAKCRLFLGTLLANSKAFEDGCQAISEGRDTDAFAEINDFVSEIQKECGVTGAVMVAQAACASGTTAIGMAFDYIRNGFCEAAVAGGADPLCKTAGYGFHALQALSDRVCNPYDKERDGINIGEGGAFFYLETLESALARKAPIYGEVIGYGLSNDAYHITAPDPEGRGAVQVMKTAIREGGITPEQVDYINGHGTGTPANDIAELSAVEQVFGTREKPPALSSTKALVGHCMGSSGAVELASILMAMKYQTYIPLPGLQHPLEGDVVLRREAYPLKLDYVLSNSFAFAGNNASILIKSFQEENML